MNYREIPETAIEIQPGLWGNLRTTTMGNLSMTKYDLYSAEGYCFYLVDNSVDGEGNPLPADQRTYYIYANSGYRTVEQVNAAVMSVPYVPGYEIASANKPNQETI